MSITTDEYRKIVNNFNNDVNTRRERLPLECYWRDRDRLSIYTVMGDSHSFYSRILPFAKVDDTADITGCDYVDQLKDVMCPHDSELLGFTLNQIRAFIDAQWKGEDGPLLTNGNANIFYCIGIYGNRYAVRVTSSHRGGWNFTVCHLSGFETWKAGSRVFRNKR